MKHDELPRVLRRAIGLIRFARGEVGASAASLFLVDVDADAVRGLVSEWDWTRTSFASSLKAWPTVARAIGDGEPRTISSKEAAGAEAMWFEPRGIATTICIPLRAEGRGVGVLFFDFAREQATHEVDVPLLVDVGDRCARALARDPAALDAMREPMAI